MVMWRQDYYWQHEPCLYSWHDSAANLWEAEGKLRHGGNSSQTTNAAGAEIGTDPAANRKLHKAKSYSKTDVLVALSMVLGSMSANKIVSATSPRNEKIWTVSLLPRVSKRGTKKGTPMLEIIERGSSLKREFGILLQI